MMAKTTWLTAAATRKPPAKIAGIEDQPGILDEAGDSAPGWETDGLTCKAWARGRNSKPERKGWN